MFADALGFRFERHRLQALLSGLLGLFHLNEQCQSAKARDLVDHARRLEISHS